MDQSADEARVLVLYTGGTIGMLRTANGFAPEPHFLASNLRSQTRFHDELQTSVFANSGSVAAFQSWSQSAAASRASSPGPDNDTTLGAAIAVRTSDGPKLLPSLVTPRSAQGKRIRYCILEYDVRLSEGTFVDELIFDLNRFHHQTLIDSAEVELSDWIRMASDIELNYSLFDSFVILHGTDSKFTSRATELRTLILSFPLAMAYSASALSFLLENLGKTVILTGAQIPLSELLNDSLDNLLGALIIAGHYTIPEVCLFFNHKLLRGNRAIKASSDEFDAFASPSLSALATIGIDIGELFEHATDSILTQTDSILPYTDVAWHEVLRPGLRAFKAHKSLSAHVGRYLADLLDRGFSDLSRLLPATLRIFPGISGSSVRAFLSAGDVRGVVLQSYGAGNAPRREELLSAFREAADRGVVIVNVSQCATGAVAPDIYETGRVLAAVGITGWSQQLYIRDFLIAKIPPFPLIGGADMTVECALAKLSYLLSKPELNPAQVRRLISQPLRGELTLSSPVPTFTSPTEANDRLRNLFSQLVSIAPTPASRGLGSPPGVHTRSLSGSQIGSPEATLPEEFALPWPASQRDAEAAENAILPYLLGQAAARPDHLLATLIESLRGSATLSAPPLTSIPLLSEPSTPSNQTPLHLAVLAAQSSNVSLLLANGASVFSRDILGNSTLFYAAKLGSSGRQIVEVLKEAGAHFGEIEVERGDVGLEIMKAERSGDAGALDVWTIAAGPDLQRAKDSLRALVNGH
ncbi:L-asparaginase, partial [Phenoliferia sp. Uapishka_3]